MRCFVLVLISSMGVLCLSVHAQVKGDPVLKTAPRTAFIDKPGSKLSPDLQGLYDNNRGARKNLASELAGSINDYIQTHNGAVVTDITVTENVAAAKASLEKMGAIVTGTYGRMISAIVPVGSLNQLAAVSNIRYARPVYRPRHQFNRPDNCAEPATNNLFGKKPDPLRPVISQGDTAQQSQLARSTFNVDGKKIKVGILSDSYNNLGGEEQGIQRGELPGKHSPDGFKKTVDVIEDLPTGLGTDEGRAMAEVVHDVAPASEIAFHTANLGQANFAQGIQDLANDGCDIMVDDILYYNEPFFQDGIIAQAIDKVKSSGVTYFSAAGNQADRSYQSEYHGTPDEVLGPGNGTAHNFSAPGQPARYYQPIFIPQGGNIVISLQWDQPFFSAGGAGATSDLDIVLIDMFGNIVSSGMSNNIASGDAAELLAYQNRTQDFTFFVVIVKRAGPDPAHLKYIIYNDGQFYVPTPAIPGLFSPTLVGHAKAAGAIATAAAFYLTTPAYGITPPTVEAFSSLGGVPNYFDQQGNPIAPLIRAKPEITAPDGGNTSFFSPLGNGDTFLDSDSFPNFFGTSASAPHAAGIAALMLDAEKHKNLTPGIIKGILSATAIDMDNIYTPGFDAGFDFNTGYGLVNARAAVAAVVFPSLYIKNAVLTPVCSTNPTAARSWKISNPNPFEMETHWMVVGTSQRGTIIAPPGETFFTTTTQYLGSLQLPSTVILDWTDNFGFSRIDMENSSKASCSGTTTARIGAGTSVTADDTRPLMAEVFPNPATTTFRVYLALDEHQPAQLELYSTDGRKLLERRINSPMGIVPIDAGAYRPGVYLLQVRQGSFNKTIKLVKQ